MATQLPQVELFRKLEVRFNLQLNEEILLVCQARHLMAEVYGLRPGSVAPIGR